MASFFSCLEWIPKFMLGIVFSKAKHPEMRLSKGRKNTKMEKMIIM